VRFNKRQKAVLLAGTLAALVIGIYPPWILSGSLEENYAPVQVSLGYGLIFVPPIADAEKIKKVGFTHDSILEAVLASKEGVSLDTARLGTEWITLIVVVIGLLLYLNDE